MSSAPPPPLWQLHYEGIRSTTSKSSSSSSSSSSTTPPTSLESVCGVLPTSSLVGFLGPPTGGQGTLLHLLAGNFDSPALAGITSTSGRVSVADDAFRASSASVFRDARVGATSPSLEQATELQSDERVRPRSRGSSVMVDLHLDSHSSSAERDGSQASHGVGLDVGVEIESWMVLRNLSSFAPKDYTLLPYVTPREALLDVAQLASAFAMNGAGSAALSSSLSMISSASASQAVLSPTPLLEARISQLLEHVDLSHVASTRIGQEPEDSHNDDLLSRERGLTPAQRGRLAIALELLSSARLLFFELPLAGLDAQSSYDCLRILSSIARTGKTVVITMHEPSQRLFNLLDEAVVFSEGHVVFHGPPDCMLPELESLGYPCPCDKHISAPDFILDLLERSGEELRARAVPACRARTLERIRNPGVDVWRQAEQKARAQPQPRSLPDGPLLFGSDSFPYSAMGVHPSELVALSDLSSDDDVARDSPERHRSLARPNRPSDSSSVSFGDLRVHSQPGRQSASFRVQFNGVLRRSFRALLRDESVSLRLFLVSIVFSLFAGAGYFHLRKDYLVDFIDIGACLFVAQIFVAIVATIHAVLAYPIEIAVFLREHRNRLCSAGPFFLARTVADLPFLVGIPVVFGTVLYWVARLEPVALCFFYFMMVLILTSFIAHSFGLLVLLLTPLGRHRNELVPIALLRAVTMCMPHFIFGGFLIGYRVMPSWLKHARWASYAGYGYEILATTEFSRITDPLSVFVTDGTVILDELGLDDSTLFRNFAALVCYAVLTRFVCYLALKRRLWTWRSSAKIAA